MESTAFDRIADRYDDTRGVDERAANLTEPMLPHLRPGPVLEIGVGTGAVARALRAAGHAVAGVDISAPMLARARDRLGPCVALADGYHLPVPTGAVPNAVLVWVLQLVPDVPAFVAEAARAVTPGGRVAIVLGGGHWGAATDDISPVVVAAISAVRTHRDTPELVLAAAGAAGLCHHRTVATAPQRSDASPADIARRIEQREWSAFWDLPAEVWTAVVEPALATLRSCPDPDRVRERWSHHDVHVFEKP